MKTVLNGWLIRENRDEEGEGRREGGVSKLLEECGGSWGELKDLCEKAARLDIPY